MKFSVEVELDHIWFSYHELVKYIKELENFAGNLKNIHITLDKYDINVDNIEELEKNIESFYLEIPKCCTDFRISAYFEHCNIYLRGSYNYALFTVSSNNESIIRSVRDTLLSSFGKKTSKHYQNNKVYIFSYFYVIYLFNNHYNRFNYSIYS